MNILAIGAHFDDLELGCGGSLLKWSNEGHRVFGLILCDSGYNDESGREIRSPDTARKEGFSAARIAGYELIEGKLKTFSLTNSEQLSQIILQSIKHVQPELIVSHWANDAHLDHRAIGTSTLHCARHIPRILFYQSNWYSSEAAFKPNFFIDISSYFDRKIELVKTYESELKRTQNLWLEWLKNKDQLSGLQIQTDYAEAFEMVKWKW